MNLSDWYAKFFSKGKLAKFNNKILLLALRANGYNNWRDNIESGEEFFIKNILAPTNPQLCIDIGANVGNYTQDLFKYTNATIVSFEPMPGAFAELKDKFWFQPRVIAVNKGVGAINSELTIHYNPNMLAHASFSEAVKKVSYVTNKEKLVVPVISLDAYCEEHNITSIDFIKIDTEGYESEVFDGAERVFSEMMPKFIQIEFNWHHLFRNKTLNYFAEQLPKYDVYQLTYNSWKRVDPKDPFANMYHFSNFVFVRKDQRKYIRK
jgi:FkbM family methyltransferase